LLLGDEIFRGQRLVALKIEMRADLVRGGAVEIGLRGLNVLLAVAVSALIVLGLRLSRRGASLGNFLGTETRSAFSALARDCISEARNSLSSNSINIWSGSTESPSRTRTLSMRPPTFEPTRMLRASTVPEPCNCVW